MQASLQRHLSLPLFPGPRHLKEVCAAACPWASPILHWAWSTPSLPSNCNPFPWKVSSRVVPPPPHAHPTPDQSLPWAASRGLQEPLGMGGTLPVVRRLRVLGQGWLPA